MVTQAVIRVEKEGSVGTFLAQDEVVEEREVLGGYGVLGVLLFGKFEPDLVHHGAEGKF